MHIETAELHLRDEACVARDDDDFDVAEAIDTVLADHAKLEAFVRSLCTFSLLGKDHISGDMWVSEGFVIQDEDTAERIAEGKDALEALRNLWKEGENDV